jgi:hypothetical protein
MRKALAVFVVATAAMGFTLAADLPESGITGEFHKLVRLHSKGEETYEETEKKITISYDSMTYHIHSPDRRGRIQNWHEELGPNTRGVVIEIYVSEKAYAGPMELPQTLLGPYYKTHCCELKEGKNFLFVHAKFGNDFPDEIRHKILKIMRLSNKAIDSDKK